ncbi:kinase-like domain-containing protein [Tuber borchii]|uniref:non-specific serine/threonine protein kinase n=1 Tax=Tuber borchii TaxID=42251 RepID=A0A2T6ZQW6_TUBBO|nr:kinase-like domain-containing protein [Tuber borchii]
MSNNDSQSPQINGIVIPSTRRTRSGALYSSIESHPPITPSEVEDRTNQAFKGELTPRQAKQASLHARPDLRLQRRLASILEGTEKLTPPQPHKVTAPSALHPLSYPDPHTGTRATQSADPPLSLTHSQPCEIGDTPVIEPPAWKLNYKIGTGAYGNVFLEHVQRPGMESPELWAVIPRALSKFTFKRYEAEINNLQALSRHEWFVKFYCTCQDTEYMYIAMEYIPMGDMSQSFADGYGWNESDTRVVIKQLLNGLVVMHKEGITHRDLKPENIFLYLPENQTHVLRVKIGDFGTSKRIPPNASTCLKTTTGTQGYMAPEMHDTSKPKTNRVDIWSLGCVLYRMFAGHLLFEDAFQVLKYAASPSPLAFDNVGLSILCISFLRDTLQPIPKNRPTAEDCLKKTWITNGIRVPEYSIGKDLYTRLSKINQQAPNVHPPPDTVANRAADSSSASR